MIDCISQVCYPREYLEGQVCYCQRSGKAGAAPKVIFDATGEL